MSLAVEHWKSKADGQFYWHVKNGENGEVMAHGEGYHNRPDLLDAVGEMYGDRATITEIDDPNAPEGDE